MTGAGRWAAAADATAAAMAILLVAGQIGRVWPPADILNQLLPVWMAIGMVAVAIRLVLRAGWPALASGAAIGAVGGAMILPEFARPRWPARADGETIRIVQLNAWKDNPDPAATAAWLAAQPADIVFLEEAQPSPAWAPLFARFSYRQGCAGSGRCSTTILSRRRPIAGGGLALADPENRRGLSAAWMRVAGRCGAVTLVAAHLPRPAPWPGAAAARDQLARFVAGQRGALIVGGDVNVAPWSLAMRGLERALGLERVTRALPSWPVHFSPGGPAIPPLLPIDHLFVGGGVTAAAIGRGPDVGSDHRPIAATFRLPDCPHSRSPESWRLR